MAESTREHLPVVQEFLHYLLDDRHFSPYTARCYAVDLRQYADFIAVDLKINVLRSQEAEILQRALNAPADGPVKRNDVLATVGPATVTGAMLKADVNLIRSFLNEINGLQYSAATMARKIATLRSFHRWMDKRGLIETNPMLLIRTPKQSKRLPKAISVDQIERLLSDRKSVG